MLTDVNESARHDSLIQRVDFDTDGNIRFGDMWSSEFEWWAIEKSRGQFSWECILFDFELKKSPNSIVDSGNRIEVIGIPWSDPDMIQKRIIEHLSGQSYPQDSIQADYPPSDENQNYFSLDGGYFFSLNGNRGNFIKWLENPRQERVSPFSQRIVEVSNEVSKLSQPSVSREVPPEFTPESLDDVRDFLMQIYAPDPEKRYGEFATHIAYPPYNVEINFSNNLARFWIRHKNLNKYVTPESYTPAPNEICIKSVNGDGYSIHEISCDIHGDKRWFDMEELTGIKMISSSNPFSPWALMNQYTTLRNILPEDENGDNKNWFACCGINHMIYPSLMNPWVFRSDNWSHMITLLHRVDLTTALKNYLKTRFPWERPDDEYEALVRTSMNILAARIHFFSYLLASVGTTTNPGGENEKDFERALTRAQRIWHRNQDELELIWTTEEMREKIDKLLQPGCFVRNTNIRWR